MAVAVLVALIVVTMIVLVLALASSERVQAHHRFPSFTTKLGAALNGEGETPAVFERIFER